MKKVYEDYSEDKKRRYIIYDNVNYYSVIVEQYYDAIDIKGYIEPEGFYEVHDCMVHHVENIDEGIKVGRELLRNK